MGYARLSLADGGARKVLGHLINDWQLSGVWTGTSGNRYDLGSSFQSNGQNVNMTGSPDFGSRIMYLTDPGSLSGCSSNQYAQFDVTAVTAPGYFSTGLESGRNLLIGCPSNVIDVSLARTIRLGGGRELRLQVDAFNAFNMVNYTARNTTINYASPTNLTVNNPQYLADATLNPSSSAASQRRLWRRNQRRGHAELPGHGPVQFLTTLRDEG